LRSHFLEVLAFTNPAGLVGKQSWITMHVRAWFLLCVLATTLLGAGIVQADAGQGYEPGLEDEGDWADDMGYQSDPAYEQYAERLQQQLESLRKEHDEIFGRADVDKVRVMAWQMIRRVVRSDGAVRPAHLMLTQEGGMSESEYFAMHREAEQGDDKNKYDQKELERAFADLDRDGSASLSLDEWRRPFEEHTDAWLQVRACVRACVHACVRACICVCAHVRVHACMRACMRACVRACVRACPAARRSSIAWHRAPTHACLLVRTQACMFCRPSSGTPIFPRDLPALTAPLNSKP
jgi:hypothetical protein